MKISKFIAAAAVTAVTMTAAAAAANAETTTVSNPDTGKTTVTIDFADMAKAYSEYLNDGNANDGGVKGSLLKNGVAYVSYTFGELPGYYGFYPNLAVGNKADYIVDSMIRIGGKKGLANNQKSKDVNGNELSSGRYLKFVPKYDCDLTVGGTTVNSKGISTNMAWCVGTENVTGSTSKTINCKKNTEYYIYSNTSNNGLTITSLSYTYDTPVVPSAEVTSFEKLNEETLKDENGGQADAYTFTVTGKNGQVSAKSVSFKIGEITKTEPVELTLNEGSTAVYGLIVSADSSKELPTIDKNMITIE